MGDKFITLVGSGQQVYVIILLNKFVAIVGSGDKLVAHLVTKKGLKDWAILKRDDKFVGLVPSKPTDLLATSRGIRTKELGYLM
jgi:hypothetical protein